MGLLIDAIYYNSPVFLQNLLVSAYGYKLNKRRYGHHHDDMLLKLEETQSLDASKLEEIQFKRFRDILSHAFKTVPFYQDLAFKTGISVKDFLSHHDITRLPIISKDQIRTNPVLYCSKDFVSRKGSFWLFTSGTSGKPLRILCDPVSRQKHYAFWSRFRRWCGLEPGSVRATFFGRIIMKSTDNKPPFWRKDIFGNNYLFSSYHMSENNLPYYYEKLGKLGVEELIGYPSSLFILAKYCLKHKLNGIRPKAVITTAETLLPQQRAMIEEAFATKVFDQYGCTEMVMFISQCEYGSYHIHPEHGIVEIVNETGQPAEIGEAGEIVCTGLLNYSMPLIRYKLGDIIRLSNRKCECGREFPVVDEIVGRTDDILFTPSGKPLGRLDPIFKGLKGIYETQIIQEAIDTLRIKMVNDNNFGEKEEKEFLYELRKRIGTEMKVIIEKVPEIPKDDNGKFRAVISRIG